MASPIRFRNRRGELADAPQVSASDAKNGFGRMLDRVAREGAVAITKHDEPCAVLIAIEEYRTLTQAADPALDTLTQEFDALFGRMQAPGAADALRKAFAMPPAALGRAALAQAAASPKRRVAAKRVRRRGA